MEIERHGHLFFGDHAHRHAEAVIMAVGNRSREIGAGRDHRVVFRYRIAAEPGVRRRAVCRRKPAVRRRRQHDEAAVESLAPGKDEFLDAPRLDDRLFVRGPQQLIRHFPQQRRPVRLIDEAGGPQRQPPIVHVLFRRSGKHDDGDLPHDRRQPHAEQELHAIHTGHQDVQEHQRGVGIPLQESERLHAVRRLENIRTVAQHLTKQGPARLIVVHDEDFFICIVHVSTSSRRKPPATPSAAKRKHRQ